MQQRSFVSSATRASAIAAATLGIAAVVGGCGGRAGESGNDAYRATIRRTSHGIPHIVASDLGSLGFGEG